MFLSAAKLITYNIYIYIYIYIHIYVVSFLAQLQDHFILTRDLTFFPRLLEIRFFTPLKRIITTRKQQGY